MSNLKVGDVLVVKKNPNTVSDSRLAVGRELTITEFEREHPLNGNYLYRTDAGYIVIDGDGGIIVTGLDVILEKKHESESLEVRVANLESALGDLLEPNQLDVFEDVDEKYRYYAVDYGGEAYVYVNKPNKGLTCWMPKNPYEDFKKVSKNPENFEGWEDSLICRGERKRDIEVNVGDKFKVTSSHPQNPYIVFGDKVTVSGVNGERIMFDGSIFGFIENNKVYIGGCKLPLEKINEPLTGSDLTIKLLENGETRIPCYVSDSSDLNAEIFKSLAVITKQDAQSRFVEDGNSFTWKCAIPLKVELMTEGGL